MGLVKAVYHRDLYCEKCQRVTPHQLVWERNDYERQRVVISAHCERYIRDTVAKATLNVCWAFQRLYLTDEQWEALKNSKPFEGESHRRRF